MNPTLTEPGVKYFISGTLKECRRFKDKYISIFFNIAMTVVLVGVFGGLLIYKYKGKLTPTEIAERNKKQQEYIFTKLQRYSTQKQKQSDNLITNLPTWEETNILRT